MLLGGNKTYFALTTKYKDDPDSTLKKNALYASFFFYTGGFFSSIWKKNLPVTKNLV